MVDLAELPTGTATFLFTDIEGSTRLLQQLGERFPEILARHHALIRSAIQAHGGREVHVHGDAFFAVFPRVMDAVLATLAAQRALAAETWPDGAMVRVRMGLHTGEAALVAGDYVGLDVHRAARLCDAAHGGQVLLSLTSRDVVARELPDDVTLHDLGEHQLKDLATAERIFQLVAPGLPRELPPLRSVDVTPHNLPVQLTSFVGREREVADLTAQLTIARVLTLVGPGGCGKTRLALALGRASLASFADGVWLTELAAVSDPGLVPQTVAFALGVREETGRPIETTLVDALRHKRLLVILDNCEHLVDASARLADALVRGCPSVQILATSREPLGIGGETRWRTPSLSLPALDSSGRVEHLIGSEAIRLFVIRAAAAEPSFVLTAENAPSVVQICRRLDGIPLAIELAAARVRVLPPEQIARRLEDGFRVLAGGGRTALPRQQTLRAAIDWSYALLEGDERRLLRRLAAFAGTFDLEAVEHVAGVEADDAGADASAGTARPGIGEPAPEILDVLTQLADKSLIHVEQRSGQARFHLLEMIRQYAAERLEEAGEARQIRQRHAVWYLALAERLEPRLWTTDDPSVPDRLELDHANLRVGLDWWQETEPDQGLRLAAALWRFWELRGYLTEGRAALESVLAVDTPTVQAGTATRARALLGAGYLARDQSDTRTARTRFEECLTVFRAIDDRWGIGSALRALGVLAQSDGDLATARGYFEQTIAIFRQIDHLLGVGWTLRNLGILAQIEGDRAGAAARFEESLPVLRQIGDIIGTGRVLGSLGILARINGESGRAQGLLEESLALVRQAGDRRGESMGLAALGFLALQRDDWPRARVLLLQSIDLAETMGDVLSIARGAALTGLLALRLGQAELGVQLTSAATAIHPRLRASLEFDEGAALDEALARAQRQVPVHEIEAAAARGAALSLGRTIALARDALREWLLQAEPAASAEGGAAEAASPSAEGATLTKREREVLRLIADGLTNREIAEALVVSEFTVMRHVGNLFRKIGVNSRAAAASFAVRQHLD